MIVKWVPSLYAKLFNSSDEMAKVLLMKPKTLNNNIKKKTINKFVLEQLDKVVFTMFSYRINNNVITESKREVINKIYDIKNPKRVRISKPKRMDRDNENYALILKHIEFTSSKIMLIEKTGVSNYNLSEALKRFHNTSDVQKVRYQLGYPFLETESKGPVSTDEKIRLITPLLTKSKSVAEMSKEIGLSTKVIGRYLTRNYGSQRMSTIQNIINGLEDNPTIFK